MPATPRLRIGVVLGGRSSEREISLESGRNIYHTLDPLRYDVAAIYMDGHGRLWEIGLPLLVLGTRPFAAALEEKLLLARYFRREVQALGFEVGPPPDLSIVTFRWAPRDLSTRPTHSSATAAPGSRHRPIRVTALASRSSRARRRQHARGLPDGNEAVDHRGDARATERPVVHRQLHRMYEEEPGRTEAAADEGDRVGRPRVCSRTMA